MAHMYLCKPQSQVRTISPSRPNAYLDDVVQGYVLGNTASPTHRAGTSPLERFAPPRTAVVHQTQSQPQQPQQHQPWRPLTEQFGYIGKEVQATPDRCADLNRSPSPPSVSREKSTSPPPPSYGELQPCNMHATTTQENDEASALRREVAHAIQLLSIHRSSSPLATAATTTAGVSAAAATEKVEAPARLVTLKKKKIAKRAQARQNASDLPTQTSKTDVSGVTTSSSSSLAFALQFLVEYEALSRRDIIIDYYAAFPQAPPLRTSQRDAATTAAAVQTAVTATRVAATQAAVGVETAPVSASPSSNVVRAAKKKKQRVAQTPSVSVAASSSPLSSSSACCRRCRLVFPGSLWAMVLRHHRSFLQHAIVTDAAAAVPTAAVAVSSLHSTAAELEVIVSVSAASPLPADTAAVLAASPFNSVWEVYNFVSGVASREKKATVPLTHASYEDDEEQNLREDVVRSPAPAARQRHFATATSASSTSRVGGAPWRLTRRQAGARDGGGGDVSSHAELVVPIVFTTAVTNKLRRAARGGANGDLHVALRRDGLYAVPSAKEVQVRATRVNAVGLYVELVFRWEDGEGVEDGAEDAMNDAPFTDTWTFLEECQPPTATTVMATVTKRDTAKNVLHTAEEVQSFHEHRPQLQSRSRVDASTEMHTEGTTAPSSQKPVRVRSVVCEVPLTSPEWRAIAAQQPDALRAALTADVLQLARETLAAAQLNVTRPKASDDGSVSIGFELDAVPEKVARRVETALFPHSFPHLAQLSPRASLTPAAPAKVERVTVGTTTHSFSGAARAVPAAVTAALNTSASTVSENFSLTDRAPPSRHTVAVATQTSFVSSAAASSSRSPSPSSASSSVKSASFHPLRREEVCHPHAVAPPPLPPNPHETHKSGDISVASSPPAASEAAASRRFVQGEVSVSETRASRASLHVATVQETEETVAPALRATEMVPSTNSTSAVAVEQKAGEEGNDNDDDVDLPSAPAVVSKAVVHPYFQGREASEVSLRSLQVTEAAPSSRLVAEELPSTSVVAVAAAPQGPRLSFSMQGDKWGEVLEEYPLLLKRAVQADVQELFGVPAAAMEDVSVAYDGKLRVVVQVDAAVPLRPSPAVAAAIAADSDEDGGALPVERLQHVWNLYDQQQQALQGLAPAQQHTSPPALSSALSSTRRPRETPMVRRQITDGRAVLNGSLKAVSVATVESLPSPAHSRSSTGGGGVVSSFHVLLDGTMWNSLLAHQEEDVVAAFLHDLDDLLADQLSELSVEAVAVQDDGRLRIDFAVPRSALPCGLNPPQFRWAVDRLPLEHLRELHNAATQRVPTTLQVRRFFEVPGLTDAAVAHHAETIRTLFVAETCAVLDTAEENLLRLSFADHLVAELTMRVPNRADAAAWQKTLMACDYAALTDFLTEISSARELPAGVAAAPVRRATLLSSSALLMPPSEAQSAGPATPAVSHAQTESRRGSGATNSEDNGGSSSAHAVCLDGPLWPTLLQERAADVLAAVLTDATAVLAPLSVVVERCTPVVHTSDHGDGALLTFLLQSRGSPDFRSVEEALQTCPFTQTRALYAELQAAVEAAEKAEELAASVYAMQLDGEAWLEVRAKHLKQLTDTFALEALTCLRGDDSIRVPVGVAVKEVLPKSKGIVVSYEVLSAAAAAASDVDRFRVAEAVEAYPFPLLWELYDSVMLTREPFKEGANPHWIAARRQRLLHTAYDVTPTEGTVVPRSYTFIGYADEADLEEYLRHPVLESAPAAEVDAATEAITSPTSAAMNVEAAAAGQEEYDFRHLPAPSPEPEPEKAKATTTTATMPPPQEAKDSSVKHAAREVTPAAAPVQPPPLPMPEMDQLKPQEHHVLPPQPPQQEQPPPPRRRHRQKHKAAASQAPMEMPVDTHVSRPRSTAPPFEKEKPVVEEVVRQPETMYATVEEEPVLAPLTATDEEAEHSTEAEDDAPTPTSITDDDADSLLGAAPQRRPLPTGPIVISGTLMVAPARLADVKPAAPPVRARSVTRIPLSPAVVIPCRPAAAPATASRPSVTAPAITSATRTDVPERVVSSRRSKTAQGRVARRASPVPEVAAQPRPSKVSARGQTAAGQADGPPLPRLDVGTLPFPSDRVAERPAVGRSSAAPLAVAPAPPRQLGHFPAAGQPPALQLPLMNRHSTAPITVTDVRMTHPPTAPAARVPQLSARGSSSVPAPAALPEGVSRSAAPQLSSSRKVSPRQQQPAPKSTDTAAPVLPTLHAATSAAPLSMVELPPTNKSQRSSINPSTSELSRKAPSTSHLSVNAGGSAPPSTSASSSPFVSPSAFDRPVAQTSTTPAASSLVRRPAAVQRVGDAELTNTPADRSPERRTVALAASASPATPAPRLSHWVPQTSARNASGKRSPAGSPSAPDLLSNGPSASHISRTSRTPSRASSSSLHGSGRSPSRSATRNEKLSGGDSTPQLELPSLRGDTSALVAVTTQPDDRLRALWNEIDAVEQSVRSRYPRMERELMVAANGTSADPSAANGKG